MEQKNILKEAEEIIYNRSQEADRQYGPMSESFEKIATMASIMSNKDLSATDCINVLIALKFVRQSYSTKRDNLMDGVAYIAGLQNYIEENNIKKYNKKK